MKKFLFLSMISACICINETDAMTELQNTQDVSLASRGIPTADAQDVNDAPETQPGSFAILPLPVAHTNAVESQTTDNITIISVDLNHANNPADLPNRLKDATSINLVIEPGITQLSPELFEQFFGEDNVAVLKSKVKSISIPDNITEMSAHCFKGWKNLSRVSFGSTSKLERIGKEAFLASGLTEISIPDSVTEIGDWCFHHCHKLARVSFGMSSKLVRIGEGAFADSSLPEISVPDSVTDIGDRCFSRCQWLHRVSFGNRSTLKHIGASAFYESTLTEISIPDSVTDIGYGCFNRCYALTKVNFSNRSQLERIGEHAFTYSNLREISIPDSVTEIGYGCFSQCFKLASVSFGNRSQLKRIKMGLLSQTLPNTAKVYGLSPERMDSLGIPKENRP